MINDTKVADGPLLFPESFKNDMSFKIAESKSSPFCAVIYYIGITVTP